MKLFKFGFLALLLISTLSVDAQRLRRNQFDNPLALQRADPQVWKHTDGYYYFIATVPEFDRIELRKTKTLRGIKTATPVVIWRKHSTGPMGNHIWAPEIHHINGVWYIYFAAGYAEDRWRLRMYALSNPSPDPTKGVWKEEGRVRSNIDHFSLDATVFTHRGQMYKIWTDRAPSDRVNTSLFIAKMINPTTIDKNQVVISMPEHPWEVRGHRVNEGPAVLIRNGKVFVAFSASATDANYCIGLLWADENSDLLNPASWTKLPEPVFYTNPKFNRYGPGHNSFTIAEDGKTVIMLYHARDYPHIIGDPLSDPNRHTRARVIRWTKDGFPDFGQDLDDNEMALRQRRSSSSNRR